MLSKNQIRIQQMLDAANEANSFIINRKKEDLNNNRILTLALIKSIEIIGEAANHIDPEIKERYSNILWNDIIGMGNRLINTYDDIDLDNLWEIVTNFLPSLINELKQLPIKKNCTILHLDDNPIICNMLQYFLESIPNITYEAVYNEKQSDQCLQTKLPDFLIVNLLRESDYDYAPGIQYIKKIYRNNPAIKIIVYTACNPIEIRKELAPFIVHFETKGGDPLAFINKIKSLLDDNDNDNDNQDQDHSNFKRQDCPFCMLITYQKLNSIILNIINAFKDNIGYNFSKTLEILWPHIQKVISPVSAIAILEINYQEDKKGNKTCVNYLVEEKAKIDSQQLLKAWDDVDQESKELIISSIIQYTEDGAWCWNGYLKQPDIFYQSHERISILLTLMSKMPDGRQYYLLFIRKKDKRPFISHEVETIRVISSIVGSFFTNAFLYKSLHATALLK
jgi:uncharacterized protein with HEPN domain/CheY-like chemotaxis protein